eukprot:GHVO01013889.1.p1 GENE.GHVO01013889.1~~GHVO01013889.1.p1  ORF type:complete len:564 (-),score=67.35 GHVO01013889.1:435-2126(-)
MTITFKHYIIFSTLSCLSVLCYSAVQYDQVYLILSWLSKSKLAWTVLVNFGFMAFLLSVRSFIRCFVGDLRSLEIDELIDNGKSFIMDTILFLVLAEPTIDGRDVPPLILIKHISVVIAMKTGHIISQIRTAHIFQTGTPRLVVLLRIATFTALLFVFDAIGVHIFVMKYKADSTFYLWLLFEFLGMLVSSLTCSLKFLIHLVDAKLEGGWPPKAAYILYIDLTLDTIALLMYLSFTIIFFISNPTRLPLYMMSDTLQSFRQLHSRVRAFRSYKILMKNIETKFADATAEDLARDDTCVICRDALILGNCKRLACSHVFHVECLKSWFVQQQVCPTCRADVLNPAPSSNWGSTPANATPNARQDEQNQPHESPTPPSQEGDETSQLSVSVVADILKTLTDQRDAVEASRLKALAQLDTDPHLVEFAALHAVLTRQVPNISRHEFSDGVWISNGDVSVPYMWEEESEGWSDLDLSQTDSDSESESESDSDTETESDDDEEEDESDDGKDQTLAEMPPKDQKTEDEKANTGEGEKATDEESHKFTDDLSVWREEQQRRWQETKAD